MSMSSGAEESTLKGGYYRLMLYAGLFGGLFSLVTTGYITLYNQGIKFFGRHIAYTCITLTFGLLSCWAYLVFFIGFAIKFFGRHRRARSCSKPNTRRPVASTTVTYQVYFFKDLLHYGVVQQLVLRGRFLSYWWIRNLSL